MDTLFIVHRLLPPPAQWTPELVDCIVDPMPDFSTFFFDRSRSLAYVPDPLRSASPISRLISAYFYCKVRPDQLCADFRGKSKTDDLLSFAEHWGNYGLMQFVLAFLTPEEIHADSGWAARLEGNPCVVATEDGQAHYLQHEPKRCPGWYMLKLFIESRGVEAGYQHEPVGEGSTAAALNQVWMHQFLQPAMGLLNEKYAAVAILEEWNTSMELFQATLEIPDFNWLTAFREGGSSRVNTEFQDAAHEARQRAMNDPKIRELLWLDILLYDHAVSVFNRQVAEHGLPTSS